MAARQHQYPPSQLLPTSFENNTRKKIIVADKKPIWDRKNNNNITKQLAVSNAATGGSTNLRHRPQPTPFAAAERHSQWLPMQRDGTIQGHQIGMGLKGGYGPPPVRGQTGTDGTSLSLQRRAISVSPTKYFDQTSNYNESNHRPRIVEAKSDGNLQQGNQSIVRRPEQHAMAAHQGKTNFCCFFTKNFS